MNNFFPAFIPLSHKKILLVGGGNIASHKLEKLIDFQPEITIVSPLIHEKILRIAEHFQLTIVRREFQETDLDNTFMVIVAVTDRGLQKKIFQLCQEKKILCNCVDLTECCSFIFPAIVKRKDLVIAISTSSKAPALSGAIKRWIETLLPDSLEEIISTILAKRKSLAQDPDRMPKIREFADALVNKIFQ